MNALQGFIQKLLVGKRSWLVWVGDRFCPYIGQI